MALIPFQFLKGFFYPLLRFMVANLILFHILLIEKESLCLFFFVFKGFFRTESFEFSELVMSPLIKGSAIFTACAEILQQGEKRAVNLVGLGSYCKSHKRNKDPISVSLPLLPNSHLRTGQRHRKKLEHYT